MEGAYSPSQGRFISRDPIDDPAFDMTPRSPEPNNSDALAMEPVLSASNDPMVRAQLARMLPRIPNTSRMASNNLYAYAENNPISYNDPSGLTIGLPAPYPKKPAPIVCPAEGPTYEFCKRYCKRICQNAMNPDDCYLRCMIRCLGIGGKTGL